MARRSGKKQALSVTTRTSLRVGIALVRQPHFAS
jgi:hypothetical protein